MKISVIGAGYVGLSTGLVLASLGNEVYFVDTNEDKIKNLNKGKLPIEEPLLKNLLDRSLKNKKAIFTTKYSKAVPESEVIFLCVGTPSKFNGEVDIRQVTDATKNIVNHLKKKPATIVIKSTVPVGTAKLIKQAIQRAGHSNFSVISNPEFLREGYSVEDTFKPDRIVIGADNEKEAKVLIELYNPIINQSLDNIIDTKLPGKVPVVLSSNISAELTKYASNAFLATKISFINEIANIAENVGGDISEISKGVGLDPRIGDKFLDAGIGWGGSCFPKDVRALHQIAGNSGYMPVLLKAVIEVNNEQRYRFLHRIISTLGEDPEGKTIGVLGAAFKANTDDVRESPAIEIISKLTELGVRVRVYDPLALQNAKLVLNNKTNIVFCKSPYETAEGSAALVVATEWPQFKNLDFKKIKKLLKEPIIIDGRNILDKEKMMRLGFKYWFVGRKRV